MSRLLQILFGRRPEYRQAPALRNPAYLAVHLKGATPWL